MSWNGRALSSDTGGRDVTGLLLRPPRADLFKSITLCLEGGLEMAIQVCMDTMFVSVEVYSRAVLKREATQ